MVKIESTVRIEFEVEMVLEALILCFAFCKLCPNTLKQFQVQQVNLLGVKYWYLVLNDSSLSSRNLDLCMKK